MLIMSIFLRSATLLHHALKVSKWCSINEYTTQTNQNIIKRQDLLSLTQKKILYMMVKRKLLKKGLHNLTYIQLINIISIVSSQFQWWPLRSMDRNPPDDLSFRRSCSPSPTYFNNLNVHHKNKEFDQAENKKQPYTVI